MKVLLPLRIVVVDPPPGTVFALQRGRSELVSAIASSPAAWIFACSVTVADATTEPPRLTGEFAQGPPAARFVYVNSGTLAGQAASCWTRRAKVPLKGIDRALLRAVSEGEARWLETRIAGRARDGGPACATVPLLGGWIVA